ncbi:MAG: ferredoxin FdxC [Planctomycetota bacterium]|nr:MAG: ferredoxin FdxC [Planctomycetota bacterium]
MAYSITSPCVDVKDQSCVEVCPVDCIHFEDGQDRMLYIDPDECIDCGACEPVCPVEAIFENEAVPADQKVWIEVNALWYQGEEGKARARARVDELVPPKG